jgi:hypothetical protein
MYHYSKEHFKNYFLYKVYKNVSTKKKDVNLYNIPYNHRPKSLIDHAKKLKSEIAYRNKFLQTQALVNYVNEFDRITGELSKSNIPPMTKEFLEKRKNKLKELVKNS